MHTYNLKCIKPRKAGTYLALLPASAVPFEVIKLMLGKETNLQTFNIHAQIHTYSPTHIQICTHTISNA